MATTEERVRDVFTQVFPLSEGTTTAIQLESLGMDSLDLVELITELEEEFDVTTEDSRVEEVVKGTLADLIAYMDELQAA